MRRRLVLLSWGGLGGVVLPLGGYFAGHFLATTEATASPTPPSVSTTGQLQQAATMYLDEPVESLVPGANDGFIAITRSEVVAITADGAVQWRRALQEGQDAVPSEGGEYIALTAPSARAGYLGPLEVFSASGRKVAEFPWPLEGDRLPKRREEQWDAPYLKLWVAPSGDWFASALMDSLGGPSGLTLYDQRGTVLLEDREGLAGGFLAAFSRNGEYFVTNSALGNSPQLVNVYTRGGRKLGSYKIGDNPYDKGVSGPIAMSHSGEVIAAVARGHGAPEWDDKLSIIAPNSGVLDQVSIGTMPRAVEVTDDGQYILLARPGIPGRPSAALLRLADREFVWTFKSVDAPYWIGRALMSRDALRVVVLEWPANEQLEQHHRLFLTSLTQAGDITGRAVIDVSEEIARSKHTRQCVGRLGDSIALAVRNWILLFSLRSQGGDADS